MKATLNFDTGKIEGFFIVTLKNGTKLYATSLIYLRDESMLRCQTYMIKSNHGSVDSSGETRPLLDRIDTIEVKGEKY